MARFKPQMSPDRSPCMVSLPTPKGKKGGGCAFVCFISSLVCFGKRNKILGARSPPSAPLAGPPESPAPPRRRGSGRAPGPPLGTSAPRPAARPRRTSRPGKTGPEPHAARKTAKAKRTPPKLVDPRHKRKKHQWQRGMLCRNHLCFTGFRRWAGRFFA